MGKWTWTSEGKTKQNKKKQALQFYKCTNIAEKIERGLWTN